MLGVFDIWSPVCRHLVLSNFRVDFITHIQCNQHQQAAAGRVRRSIHFIYSLEWDEMEISTL